MPGSGNNEVKAVIYADDTTLYQTCYKFIQSDELQLAWNNREIGRKSLQFLGQGTLFRGCICAVFHFWGKYPHCMISFTILCTRMQRSSLKSIDIHVGKSLELVAFLTSSLLSNNFTLPMLSGLIQGSDTGIYGGEAILLPPALMKYSFSL